MCPVWMPSLRLGRCTALQPCSHRVLRGMVVVEGRPPCVTFHRVVAPLRDPGQSPVLPFACCVGSLRSVGRCGRCSCWCRFRVCGAQWLVCRGCAGCVGHGCRASITCHVVIEFDDQRMSMGRSTLVIALHPPFSNPLCPPPPRLGVVGANLSEGPNPPPKVRPGGLTFGSLHCAATVPFPTQKMPEPMLLDDLQLEVLKRHLFQSPSFKAKQRPITSGLQSQEIRYG